MFFLASTRIHVLKDSPIRSDGRYVVYWMTMSRRLQYNFALQRAVAICRETRRPLVILEPLRIDYPYASDRFHAFIIQGMKAHAAALARGRVRYYPYVEPRRGAGRGLVPALAADAVAVVTDWYPAFFLPRMTHAAGKRIQVRLEAVDSNGVLPVTAAGRAFSTAHSFRAYLQRTLRDHLREWPDQDPLAALPRVARVQVSQEIRRRWPDADRETLEGRTIAGLRVDHSVPPAAITGGTAPARARLQQFVTRGLADYGEQHNQPERDATSRLSPWLHFGHLSVHEVFDAVMKHERWSARRLPARSRGAREGWWNVSPSAESFLDELLTWRELAFNTAAFVPGFATFDSLPQWAQRTLNEHRSDPRPHTYDAATFERAATHDPLWNAVQRQLVRDGWFHGYLRMLWGKKILEWSPSPEAALETMERLMNRHSLDGRDPNSWAGFTWVLGRYDRPWPERDVLGKVRYMSSENTARKLRVKQYVAKYSRQ
jgi:deoxyribodipyrimidine photo-lyase